MFLGWGVCLEPVVCSRSGLSSRDHCGSKNVCLPGGWGQVAPKASGWRALSGEELSWVRMNEYGRSVLFL